MYIIIQSRFAQLIKATYINAIVQICVKKLHENLITSAESTVHHVRCKHSTDVLHKNT